ncbi:MAG: hypothetical protein ACKPKO_08455, partial [Candidatus Fonsibacter sp.]
MERRDLGAGLRNFTIDLQAGEGLVAAMAAGGKLIVTGAGERLEFFVTQPAWIRVYNPEQAAIRAAEWGHNALATIQLEQIVNEVWLASRARPRPPAADAAAPTGSPPLAAAPILEIPPGF